MGTSQKIHLGVYGIYENRGLILFVKKNRGPYAGKYDLPGGKIEFYETIDDALKREIKEETGGEMGSATFLTNEEYQCTYLKDGEQKNFHHVGLYYIVDLFFDEIKNGPDGHDSDGVVFRSMEGLSEDMMAPIAYKALKKFYTFRS